MNKSSRHLDYQNIPLTIAAMGKEYPDGYVSRAHSHPRGQFLHAISGVMEVTTPEALWVVPPRSALWIPPGTLHETRMRGAVTLRTLYVDTNRSLSDAPTTTTSVLVSRLLQELIIRAVEMPLTCDLAERDNLVFQLIQHEINWHRKPSLSLKQPRDPRLQRIFKSVQSAPDDERSLQNWAAALGTSSRTLARLFKAEFNLSFRDWRQQMRLLAAIPLLLAGTQITKVASDVGYDTPSAFSSMFRRVMGVTPKQYLSLG